VIQILGIGEMLRVLRAWAVFSFKSTVSAYPCATKTSYGLAQRLIARKITFGQVMMGQTLTPKSWSYASPCAFVHVTFSESRS